MAEDEIELVSREEAVAEVRRWLEVDGVDPEAIFTALGDRVIRYKDLIAHVEEGTPDGEMLRFAISRGRVMRPPPRRRTGLLQIGERPPVPQHPEDEGE
jgi:hypothetical protein